MLKVLNSTAAAYKIETGMPPLEAILSATRNAADLLGAQAREGTIQAVRSAGVIAVGGDPLKDITELLRVTVVMKGGRIDRRAGDAAGRAARAWEDRGR